MIYMPRTTLQEAVFMFVNTMDETSEAFKRFSSLLLTAMGIVDPEGNLAADYAQSPFWALADDGMLYPSAVADLASMALGNDLGDDNLNRVLGTLGVGESQQASLKQWFASQAKGVRGDTGQEA